MPIKVLAVDDEEDVRHLIQAKLKKAGFEVITAVNGEEGVAKCKSEKPDVVIMDWMMPKMDGNQLVKILKNDERTSHIPIILLTAKAGQENKLEGLEIGADEYLTKPFDIKELHIRIKNLNIQFHLCLTRKYMPE